MIRFIVEEGRIEITKEVFLVKEFKELYDYDISKEKDLAYRSLEYVYNLCDNYSPFADEDKDEKEAVCMNNSFYKEKPIGRHKLLLDAAVSKYLDLNRNCESRIIAEVKEKIDEIRLVFKSTKPEIVINVNEKSGEKKFASNIDLIAELMKEVDNMSAIKDKMEAKLKNKVVNEKLRGSQDKSVLEELLSKGKI